MSRKFDLIKIVKIGLTVLKRARIPYYWSKYSRKDYTLHQHIMLIVLAQYVERMRQYIWAMDRVRKVMRLKRIPHKSTISRELSRMPERWIRLVVREVVKIVGMPRRFAVDSTGIQISPRSYYYTLRIGESGKIREGLKLHVAVDVVRKIITNAFATKWRVNDSPYLIPLLEDEVKIEEIYADKGYDSLKNIRCRRMLKLSKSQKWLEKYSHRNIVESVFHSFKRVVGDYILARSFSSASKLLLFKVLAYDLYI